MYIALTPYILELFKFNAPAVALSVVTPDYKVNLPVIVPPASGTA